MYEVYKKIKKKYITKKKSIKDLYDNDWKNFDALNIRNLMSELEVP